MSHHPGSIPTKLDRGDFEERGPIIRLGSLETKLTWPGSTSFGGHPAGGGRPVAGGPGGRRRVPDRFNSMESGIGRNGRRGMEPGICVKQTARSNGPETVVTTPTTQTETAVFKRACYFSTFLCFLHVLLAVNTRHRRRQRRRR